MLRTRLLLAAFLAVLCALDAHAEITFAIGEPAPGARKSGVGLISGWAVSDRGIVSVEAFIDGESLGPMPYGSQRGDVAALFPDLPDALHSGWGMKWAYPLHRDGEHELTVVVTETGGATASQSLTFEVVGFASEFIADPASVRTAGATVTSTEDGRLVISGAEIEGETVDLELAWDTAAQQFLIDDIQYPDRPQTNQAPTASAGGDITVESGDAVSVTGSGSDSDGAIAGWRWSRTGGLAVALRDSDTRTVRFTAPAASGEIRLRLTVTDDDGATGSDDVTVTVVAPPNRAPTADAGPDRTVQAGASVSLAGDGTDPDGSIVGWSWRQVEGASVSLSGASTRDVSFTAPDKAATLRLRLTVTDDDGATDTDDVVITVEAPVDADTTTGATLQSMLSHINAARTVDRNCGSTAYPAQPPLEWSASLAEIAMIHSMDMARQGYFAHTSLDGTTMGERVFPYWSGNRVGENIAASSDNRSDAAIVGLWLDSPGHCALIMDPDFTHAGIGVGHDPENGYDFHHFWTLDFGG